MTKKKKISDADLSNAGDDFHVLWTIKKSFELLNFDDKALKAITLENFELNESSKLDETGEKLLGIDLVEYYGGEDLKSADNVVVSQLKYSTRRATEDWSIAKLYKGKKANSYDGSVIHRLATIYKTLLDEWGRDLVLKKLKIKLVSNRNFSESDKKTIDSIQKLLVSKNSKTRFSEIAKSIRLNNVTFEKFQKASKLTSIEFTDFIRLLNFEECGVSSRYFLKLEIINAIRQASMQSTPQYQSIFSLVWNKMMPESNARNKITKEDVLICFDLQIDDLFPVSQKFEKIDNYVLREQLSQILGIIENNQHGVPICIHAGAGMGKSVFTQLIEKNLPDYCESIVFDCYGAGEYLNPADVRHQHKIALLHICNVLAKKLGTSFLLDRNESSEVYLKQLKRRLSSAIDILKKRNSNAYLVLIIDAADNSVTASQKDAAKSFVQDILNMPFPEGAKLIVTTRTHRKELLDLPDGYIDIEINRFSLAETSKHIKYSYPDISEQEILDFHYLTNGIPRVQSYSLDLKKSGISEIINYLKPNGKNVEDLISEKIIEAEKRLGIDGKNLINIFFSYLITLPRPVPLFYLERITKINKEIFIDLATDIWHGLILDNNRFHFRDEDFENYIRGKYQANDTIKKNIADSFFINANIDEYASVNLGNSLYAADYKEKLIDIVLNRKFLALPIDPIRNKEVYIERTKLAMKVSSSDDKNEIFFKLLIIAANEAKTDKALSDLLINNADLAVLFGDNTSIERLNLKSEDKSWGGAFHLRLAAIYSRKQESVENAKKHLNTAEKWIEWRQGLDDDERHKYRLDAQDISFGTEAYLRIFGANHAYNWINHWQPKNIMIEAGKYLLDNILLSDNNEQLVLWLKESNLKLDAKIFVANRLYRLNKSHLLDINIVAIDLIQALSKKVKFEKYFFSEIIRFCEILVISNSTSIDQLVTILDSIEIYSPQRIPSFYSTHYLQEDELLMDLYLRKETLKQSLINKTFTIENLYPAKFAAIEEEKDYKIRKRLNDEKDEFKRFFNHAISIYKLRSDVFCNNDINDFVVRCNNICKLIKDDFHFRYYNNYQLQYQLNFLAGRLIDVGYYFDNKEELINNIINSFTEKQQNQISLRFVLLDKIVLSQTFSIVQLKLLDALNELIENSDSPANEKVKLYIRCSSLANKIDANLGKYYFEKAVDSLSDIDLDAYEQINCLFYLTEVGINNNKPRLAYEFIRFIENCYEKLRGYDHFPFVTGIRGIANLDISSAFAVSCRWNHRNIIDHAQYLNTIVKQALEEGFIDNDISSSLLTMNAQFYSEYLFEYYKLIISRFDEEGNGYKKNYFIQNLLKDLKLSKQIYLAKEIYKLIKDGKYITSETLLSFKEYVDFEKCIIEKKEEYKTDSIKDKRASEIDLSEVDINSTTSLEKAITIIKEKENSYYSRTIVDDFLEATKRICTPNNYVNHLNAVIDINSDIIEFDSFEKAIKDRINDWSFHPNVNKWKKERFRYVFLNWFSHFDRWENGISIWGIRNFAKIFSIDSEELAKIIIEILPSKIETLSPESLYSLVELIKNRLNKLENENIIDWTLSFWNSKTNLEVADGIWSKDLMPPISSNEVIAQLYRYYLGHPDKRERWRAMHSLRRLVNIDNTEILKVLLIKQNDKGCFPFQNKGYTYYWISAKLYLWITLARISKEKPEKLLEFSNEFYSELHNKDLPHILIRYFIQKTCLNIIEYDNDVYSAAEKKNIIEIFNSQVSKIKKKYLPKKSRNYIRDKELRFHFDPIDTIPYWYDTIGSYFNLSGEDVASIAEKYICEKWGYVGNAHKDNHVKTSGSEDYYLTANRHGSLPTIESLQIYYEYHAMYCAANDLLDNVPMSEDEDRWRSWDGWLHSEALVWDDYWLADLTDANPLEIRFWKSEYTKFDENWKDNIGEEKFDETVGLLNNHDMNLLTPYADYTRHFGNNYEKVSILSAIAPLKSSEALLRALQTTKNHHDYAIPFEKNENDYDDEVSDPEFILKGWLEEFNSSNEGLDQDDPFGEKVAKAYVILGTGVQQIFGIEFSKDFKLSYQGTKQVALYKTWSNITDQRYKSSDNLESGGSYLHVDIKLILEYLKKCNKGMIIECTITRTLEDRDQDYSTDRYKSDTKIYLIKPDGEVKTIRGRNYKIGKEIS